jgi:hypothetical protein
MALMVETSDPAKMTDALDKFTAAVKELGTPMNHQEANGLAYYSVKDQSNAEQLAIGIGKNYFVVGSSGGFLEDLYDGKSSLSRSASYQKALKTLPSGMAPVFYVDVENLLGTLREVMTGSQLDSFNQQVRILQPIPVIIGGSAANGNVAKGTIVILVNQSN